MIEDCGIVREEFTNRIDRALKEMKKSQIDLLYVYGDASHPENVTYMTNFRPIGTDMPGYGGYNAVFLLSREGEPTLIIDRDWYLESAESESWVGDIIAAPQGDTVGLSLKILDRRGLLSRKIEMDVTFMPTPVYRRVTDRIQAKNLETELNIVARMREIKSEKEIELIAKGLQILAKAHEAALSMTKEGISEIELAQEIRRVEMFEGAEYATALFVDAGRRSTIALASPMATGYKLKKGDMVLVSLFCVYKKYSAGMDRNWVVGEATERQRKLAEIELKTLEQALSLVRPGMNSADFMKPVYHDFAEPLLKAAGFTDYNIQGYVGHGTGIQICESPMLWEHNPTILKSGMVIDMEPGIYSKDPKIGGIRTADFIVVTENGFDLLTDYPRRLGSLS